MHLPVTDKDQFSLVLCMAAEVMVAEREPLQVLHVPRTAQEIDTREETVSLNEVIALSFLLSSAEPGPCPNSKTKPWHQIEITGITSLRETKHQDPCPTVPQVSIQSQT